MAAITVLSLPAPPVTTAPLQLASTTLVGPDATLEEAKVPGLARKVPERVDFVAPGVRDVVVRLRPHTTTTVDMPAEADMVDAGQVLPTVTAVGATTALFTSNE